MKKALYIFLCLIILLWVYLGGYIHSGSQHIPPHFHANFAVFINGEKVDFTDDTYMEDVAGCSLTNTVYPKDRAHLHENNGDTIHIHNDGVAWGHFFANNNIYFWENFLRMDDGIIYESYKTLGVSYILNGVKVENPYNTLIHSEDKLLVSYGDNQSDEQLNELYWQVSSNAWEYNSKYDPGSCGGTNESGIKVLLREFIHSFYTMEH